MKKFVCFILSVIALSSMFVFNVFAETLNTSSSDEDVQQAFADYATTNNLQNMYDTYSATKDTKPYFLLITYIEYVNTKRSYLILSSEPITLGILQYTGYFAPRFNVNGQSTNQNYYISTDGANYTLKSGNPVIQFPKGSSSASSGYYYSSSALPNGVANDKGLFITLSNHDVKFNDTSYGDNNNTVFFWALQLPEKPIFPIVGTQTFSILLSEVSGVSLTVLPVALILLATLLGVFLIPRIVSLFK